MPDGAFLRFNSTIASLDRGVVFLLAFAPYSTNPAWRRGSMPDGAFLRFNSGIALLDRGVVFFITKRPCADRVCLHRGAYDFNRIPAGQAQKRFFSVSLSKKCNSSGRNE